MAFKSNTLGDLRSDCQVLYEDIFEDICRNQHSCDQRTRARSLEANTISRPLSSLSVSLSLVLPKQKQKGEGKVTQRNQFLHKSTNSTQTRKEQFDHSRLPWACTGQKSSVYGVCNNQTARFIIVPYRSSLPGSRTTFLHLSGMTHEFMLLGSGF